MTDSDEMRRIADDDAAHPALKKALGALRASAEPDADALARLQGRLAISIARSGTPVRRVTLVKVIAVLGVVGLLTLSAWPAARHESHELAVPPAPIAAVSEPPAIQTPPGIESLPPSPPPSPSATAAPQRPHAKPLPSRIVARRAVQAEPRADATDARVRARPSTSGERTSMSQSIDVSRPSTALERTDDVGPRAARAAKEPDDEAQLLARARIALRSDPALTLALVEEHKARFPAASLAPERKVLAVEALRMLGRTGDADLRARAFRERYPQSVYLRRMSDHAAAR